ncbi:hypothetical protein GCM10027562_42990 [Arthrobacter pigmenti]
MGMDRPPEAGVYWEDVPRAWRGEGILSGSTVNGPSGNGSRDSGDGSGNTATDFDHGMVGRFNAWFFTFFVRYINHAAGIHKAAAFDGIDAGTVVEIGAGTGANLGYLEPGSHLYAVEPNRRMHTRLRRRCQAAGVDLTILPTGAESIPLPDESVPRGDVLIGAVHRDRSTRGRGRSKANTARRRYLPVCRACRRAFRHRAFMGAAPDPAAMGIRV